MNKIKVFLDRHFPYDTSRLNTPTVEARKVQFPGFLSRFLGRIYHVGDMYAKSFTADVILGNRRTTLMLGLLYHIYKPKRVSLAGYEIIFNFKDNLRNKAVIFMWRIAVRKIDQLIVMSSSERQYLAKVFRAELQRIKTIPFYAENADFIGPATDGYIFAAGRMERDFITLLQALQQTELKAVIVADASQKETLEPLKSDNVKIFYNIPKQQYLDLLERARMVVVPLYKGAASRGQVVILEAMKYGKPVICSHVAGTVDYIEDGKTGLLVEAENTSQMRSVLERYYDDTEALQRLGRTAFETQRSQFSEDVFYRNYLETIHQLAEQDRKTRKAAGKRALAAGREAVAKARTPHSQLNSTMEN